MAFCTQLAKIIAIVSQQGGMQSLCRYNMLIQGMFAPISKNSLTHLVLIAANHKV